MTTERMARAMHGLRPIVVAVALVCTAGCGPAASNLPAPAGTALTANATAPADSSAAVATPASAATFGPDALATLTAVRDEPDLIHRCSTNARDALQALASTYPLEPLVRAAARKIMPECRDQASLVAMLEAVPEAARSRDEQLDLARMYLRELSRFADAEKLVKPLLDADPNNTDLLSLYAAALFYQGRFAEASRLVDRRWTVLVREQNVDIMTMRADQFLKDGRPDRAEAILRQVLAIAPEHMFALNTLRQVRSSRGDTAGADAAAATAQALESAMAVKAKVSAEIGERFQDFVDAFDRFDYATAESIVKELIAQTDDDAMLAELYYSLGTVYQQMGHIDDATKARDQSSMYANRAKSTQSEGAQP